MLLQGKPRAEKQCSIHIHESVAERRSNSTYGACAGMKKKRRAPRPPLTSAPTTMQRTIQLRSNTAGVRASRLPGAPALRTGPAHAGVLNNQSLVASPLPPAPLHRPKRLCCCRRPSCRHGTTRCSRPPTCRAAPLGSRPTGGLAKERLCQQRQAGEHPGASRSISWGASDAASRSIGCCQGGEASAQVLAGVGDKAGEGRGGCSVGGGEVDLPLFVTHAPGEVPAGRGRAGGRADWVNLGG